MPCVFFLLVCVLMYKRSKKEVGWRGGGVERGGGKEKAITRETPRRRGRREGEKNVPLSTRDAINRRSLRLCVNECYGLMYLLNPARKFSKEVATSGILKRLCTALVWKTSCDPSSM
jgi:hypothetical protein